MKNAAGITLWQPEISALKQNLDAIAPQIDEIFLVDNGSSNLSEIKNLLEHYPNTVLIENGQNFGIAKALNQLCSQALAQKYKWLLLLDQDSVAQENILLCYTKYVELERVALISCLAEDRNEPDIIRSEATLDYEPVERAITSGSFVNLAVWKAVGGFDERMFIDCVDFDYCATLRENGYIVLRINEKLLYHRLGRAQEVRFFMPFGRFFHIKSLKRPLMTYNHPPVRTYYYARNIKYYCYKHRNFIHRRQERRSYLKWVILKLGFEDQKWAKLCAMVKGRADACKMIREYKASAQNKQ